MAIVHNRLQENLDLLQFYFPLKDLSLLKEISPFCAISFLSVYSFLLITDGYYFLIFLIIGFGTGAFYFSNNRDVDFQFKPFERNLSYYEQTIEQFSNSTDPVKNVVLYYPPLTVVVNQLLDYIMRDFISSWWTPINEHKDPTFEKLARERLNVVFLNVQKILLNQERNDIVMSTMYGLANTLIIHMRECRSFEESALTMEQYVIENPQSPFSQLLSTEEQHQQLRGLSQMLLKRTLPTQDSDSLLLVALFKELLATFVFGAILDNLSDPDVLNCWIVDLLSDEENHENIVTAVSAAILADTDISPPSPVKPTTEAVARSSSEAEDDDVVIVERHRQSSEDQRSTTNVNNHAYEEREPEQTTPPNTPEPRRAAVMGSQKNEPPPMIFTRGSVNFTIMDISASQQNEINPNKTDLVYIIQIERPALEDQAGSEGGGYVITRTYADFEAFHAIVYSRHLGRAAKLQLKLPLDIASSKGWLKKPSSSSKRTSLQSVGPALERYIEQVINDIDLGTDPIIVPFLRKERRSEVDEGGAAVSFSEEFKDKILLAYSILADNNNSHKPKRTLFSRQSQQNNSRSSTVDSYYSSSTEDLTARPSMDLHGSTANDKWFAPKNAVIKTRTGSFSSIKSNTSKDNSVHSIQDEEEEISKSCISADTIENEKEPLPIQHQDTPTLPSKALSSMDVELLIETTYALIVEIFNLTSTNNKAWMRRSILNLLREIVRRSYAEFISEQYSDIVNKYMSPDALAAFLNNLGEQFWPEGKWALDEKTEKTRTEEDKKKSKMQARDMLMTRLIPNAVRQLIGDQNCNTAMDRIWARCQDPRLNRVLILQVLERIIKPVLG